MTGLERIGGFGGKADRLNQYNVFLGNPDRFEADVKRHRNASWAGVRDAAKKWLDTRNRLLIRFHPETSGRESSVALNRAEQPAFGADRPFQAPEVQTTQLPNGMDLFVVERKDLPKVAVLLATRAGSVADPPGKEGLADLTVVTIKGGTKTRKALEIEDALGDLGTSINGFGGRERSGLAFDVLKRNLAPAMAIFADVVRNPVFPARGSGSRKENARGYAGAGSAGAQCDRVSRERDAGVRRRTSVRPPATRLAGDGAIADQ